MLVSKRIMNQHVKIFQICLFLVIIHQSNQCRFEVKNNRTSCTNFIEASAEASDDWYKLIVYNNDRLLNLRANAFLRMPNLRELTVSSVKSIQVGAFNGLHKLDKLIIFDTQLTHISTSIIENLPIRNIQIFKNPNFTSIAANFFENLPQIAQVDIRKNNLGTIQSGIFNNTQIYKLYLDSNHIHTIEDNAFANMEELTTLSLTDNDLIEFDSNRIFGGKSYSLSTIWLNKNQLMNIDKVLLQSFPIVKKLYFELNQISFIENGVFNLTPAIDFLDISNNLLVEISAKMFPAKGLKELTYLFLHNNRFTFLDEAVIYRLPKVRYITFRGNPLQCPCLDQITDLLHRKNITNICENEYDNGDRPSCITSDLSNTDCIEDSELTDTLYEAYTMAVADYSKLKPKCDTTKGVANAVLIDL